MRHLIFFHINLLEHWSLADKHVRIESDFVSNSGTLGRSHVIVGSTIKTALVDEGLNLYAQSLASCSASRIASVLVKDPGFSSNFRFLFGLDEPKFFQCVYHTYSIAGMLSSEMCQNKINY